MPDSPDWYAILALTPEADDAAIKAAHRRLAREVHPDVNDANDAHERMSALNRARDILLDPAQRAAFDRTRVGSRATAAPAAGMRRAPSAQGAGRGTSGRMRFTFDTDSPIRPDPPEPAAGETPAQAARWRFDVRGGHDQEDWYAFLGLGPWATEDEIMAAIRGLVGQSTAVSLSPEQRVDRQAKLRMAWEVLGKRPNRAAYDRSRPAWSPGTAGLADYYKLIGVRRRAPAEEIGEAVARLSHESGAAARERAPKLREAWWVLRDPARRAAYDAALPN